MNNSEDHFYKKAFNYSVWVVSKYPQTQFLLEKKLRQRGYEPHVIASVLQRMLELGYLNDSQYAMNLIRRYAAKGWGLKKIRGTLIQKGIADEIIQEAMSSALDDPEDRLARSLEIAQGIYSKIPAHKDRRSILARRLVARGYSSDEIFRIFEHLDFSCVDID